MPNSSEEGSGEDSISKSGSCTIVNLVSALDDSSLDELHSLGSSLSIWCAGIAPVMPDLIISISQLDFKTLEAL